MTAVSRFFNSSLFAVCLTAIFYIGVAGAGQETFAQDGLPRGTVYGTVLDAATGDPIDGATVRAAASGAVGAQTQTGPDGGYVLADVPAGGQVITASKQGYHPRRHSVEVVLNARVEVNFELTPMETNLPGVIVGQVVDSATSAPIVQAEVMIQGQRRMPSLTDNQGRYRIEGMLPGGHVVIAGKTGYEPQRQSVEVVAGQIAEANFALNPLLEPTAGSIAGRVTDANTGAAIAQALVIVEIPGMLDPANPIGGLSQMTGPDGRYEFAAVPVGIRVVRAMKQGYEPDMRRVEALPGQTSELNFALVPLDIPQLGAIAGRVIDAQTNEPIPEARIILDGNGVATSTQPPVLTGPDGIYRIGNVPAGSHGVVAFKDGYRPAGRPVVVEPNRTAFANFELLPSGQPNSGAVYGRVLNAATRQPIAGAILRLDPTTVRDAAGNALTGTDRNGSLVTRTDDHGNYVMAHVPAGFHVLQAMAPGFQSDIVRGDVLPGDRIEANFDLVPIQHPDVGRIHGSVQGFFNGNGIPGALIVAYSMRPPTDDGIGNASPTDTGAPDSAPAGDALSGVLHARTNENGLFRMGNVRPGPYIVVAHHPRFIQDAQFVIVHPGESGRVDFELLPNPNPARSVRVEVKCLCSGDPIPGARVRLAGAPPLAGWMKSTNAEGKAVLQGVPCGEFVIVAEKEGYEKGAVLVDPGPPTPPTGADPGGPVVTIELRPIG